MASPPKQQIRSRESLDSEAKSHPGAEDRISKLPDGILHHILSFIPSKEVVRTSILATRWKNIWAYAPRLILNDEEFSSSAEFIAFVDRALLIRDSAAIQIFHLNFKSYLEEDFPIVDRWLCTVVRCNVVELSLQTPFYTGCSLPVFENLRKLELDCADRRWWKLLMKFLERSPNLESFVIYKSYCPRGEAEKKIVHTEKTSPNLECFVLYKERNLYPHEKEAFPVRRFRLKPKPGCLDVQVVEDVLHWSPPTVVPKCLMASLKIICICGFQGKDYVGYLDEMELIKYLLKHGQALESMAIHTPEVLLTKGGTADHWSSTKEEFCNEITASELGSKTVQVQFFENKLYRW